MKLRSRERHDRQGAIIAQIKDVPCADCGGRFHHCQMQFDHRPGEVKEFGIGLNKAGAMDKILKEIAKCDVVCANCHALRTWKRVQERKRVRDLDLDPVAGAGEPKQNV